MIATLMLLVAPPLVPVQGPFSEGPALGFDRVTQTDIVGGGMTLDEIRAAGLVMFAASARVDGAPRTPSRQARHRNRCTCGARRAPLFEVLLDEAARARHSARLFYSWQRARRCAA